MRHRRTFSGRERIGHRRVNPALLLLDQSSLIIPMSGSISCFATLSGGSVPISVRVCPAKKRK